MDSAVSNENNRPVFFRRDVMFTKIVVDTIEIDGIRYTVYFAGTNTGHVHKIVEWYGAGSGPMSSSFGPSEESGASFSGQQTANGNGGAQSALVEIIDATSPEPVRALEISSRHKSLYVASDSQVKQINLFNCKQRHDNCLQCIRDPYCGWDRRHLDCRNYSPLE